MRQDLKAAVKMQDKRHLSRMIKRCVSAGFPDLDDDVKEARDVLDTLQGGPGG